MYKLFIKNGSVALCDGLVVFENFSTGNRLTLSGREEFVLYLEENGQTEAIPSTDFVLAGVTCSTDCYTALYKKGGLQVAVEYRSKEDVFVKQITVSAKNPIYIKRVTLENRKTSVNLAGGGEGFPVFAGDEMWCGIEFPAANNRYFEGALSFTQAPFERADKFVSLPVVYAFNSDGNIARSFERYISKKAIKKQPVRIYCDWGLHDDLSDEVILTEKLTLDNIEKVADFCEKSGVKFDYYLMDAFWFELDDAYMGFKKETFPNGADRVIKALEEKGFKYGLWFDINFIHAHMKNWEKYDTMLNNGSSCFAVKEVADLMEKAIAHHIRKHGVKMLKLDFAYFECFNPSHGHSTELIESKERSIKNFINMVKNLREIEPSLKILCYNGWTTSLDWIGSVQKREGHAISPYWCEIVDYLYCGDPRASEIPCEDFSNSIIYYTDAMIRSFRDSAMPFGSIDDHGTMMGNTGTIYYLGKKTFRLGSLMDIMRGGEKVHLYGDLSELDGQDMKYFKLTSDIYQTAMDGGYRAEFILGNAAKGEVYGYSLSDGAHGYDVILNPTADDYNGILTKDCWEGVNISITKLVVDGEMLEESPVEYGGGYTFNVSSNGYLLIEWKISSSITTAEQVVFNKGDNLKISTKGKDVLAVRFRETNNVKPIRTCMGYPEGLTITDGQKPLKSTINKGLWSGVSWLYLDVSDTDSVLFDYCGQGSLIAEYYFKEKRR